MVFSMGHRCDNTDIDFLTQILRHLVGRNEEIHTCRAIVGSANQPIVLRVAADIQLYILIAWWVAYPSRKGVGAMKMHIDGKESLQALQFPMYPLLPAENLHGLLTHHGSCGSRILPFLGISLLPHKRGGGFVDSFLTEIYSKVSNLRLRVVPRA